MMKEINKYFERDEFAFSNCEKEQDYEEVQGDEGFIGENQEYVEEGSQSTTITSKTATITKRSWN